MTAQAVRCHPGAVGSCAARGGVRRGQEEEPRPGTRGPGDPGTGELHLRASGPAPGSRLAAPRRLLPCGNRRLRGFSGVVRQGSLALAACAAPPEREERTKMSCGALPAPSSLIQQRCVISGVPLHQALENQEPPGPRPTHTSQSRRQRPRDVT